MRNSNWQPDKTICIITVLVSIDKLGTAQVSTIKSSQLCLAFLSIPLLI